MSQTTAKKLLTFQEYLAFDDGTDLRYELVDGELVEMPPESQTNNDITKYLLFELAKHAPAALVAFNTELEVMGKRARCRLPDLIVHTEESKAALIGKPRATITAEMPPPALVVEVVSPGAANRACDYRHKRTEYAARGIQEYWIVDPETQQVTVCKWVDGQYEDTVFAGASRIESDVVPGWDSSIDRLFVSVLS